MDGASVDRIFIFILYNTILNSDFKKIQPVYTQYELQETVGKKVLVAFLISRSRFDKRFIKMAQIWMVVSYFFLSLF